MLLFFNKGLIRVIIIFFLTNCGLKKEVEILTQQPLLPKTNLKLNLIQNKNYLFVYL